MTTETKKILILRSLKAFHFLATVALFIFFWWVWLKKNDIVFAARYNYFVYILFVITLLYFDRVYNAYAIEFTSVSDVALSLCLSSSICILTVYLIVLIAWNRLFSPKFFLVLIACTVPFNFLWAYLSQKVFNLLTGRIPAVFIYSKKADFNLLYEINDFNKKYFLIASIDNPQTYKETVSSIDEAEAVFISGIDTGVRNDIVKYCMEKDVSTFVMPRIGDVLLMCGTYMSSFSNPTVYIRPTVYPEYQLLKRLSDIILSVAAIIITSPLMLLTAICIRCYDGGPAIYKQVRLTIGGKKFYIYKFRSMYVGAEADGVARLSTGENDLRITPVGKIIRKFRLDELPQLFNILRGEMSFVGPRPERPEIAEVYEAAIPEYKLRLRVKAGLTGYAQVYGKYNSDPHDKLEMDLIYISKMNPLLDLRLMFATIRTLFLQESTRGIAEDKITALSGTNDKRQ